MSRATTVCAITGAVLLVTSDLVEVHGSDSPSRLAHNVAAHPDRWMTSYSIQMVGALLLAAGLLSLLRGRGGRGDLLARIGAGWLVVALVGLVAEAATELMLVPVTSAGASSTAIATVQRMNESASLLVVFLLYLPGIVLAPLLLSVGLARAGRTPWPVVPVVLVADVVAFVLTGSLAGSVASAVLMGILVWWCHQAEARPAAVAPAEPAVAVG